MSYTGILILAGIGVALILLIALAIWKPVIGIPALLAAAAALAWAGHQLYTGLQT